MLCGPCICERIFDVYFTLDLSCCAALCVIETMVLYLSLSLFFSFRYFVVSCLAIPLHHTATAHTFFIVILKKQIETKTKKRTKTGGKKFDKTDASALFL